jgi:hypothetical protein
MDHLKNPTTTSGTDKPLQESMPCQGSSDNGFTNNGVNIMTAKTHPTPILRQKLNTCQYTPGPESNGGNECKCMSCKFKCFRCSEPSNYCECGAHGTFGGPWIAEENECEFCCQDKKVCRCIFDESVELPHMNSLADDGPISDSQDKDKDTWAPKPFLEAVGDSCFAMMNLHQAFGDERENAQIAEGHRCQKARLAALERTLASLTERLQAMPTNQRSVLALEMKNNQNKINSVMIENRRQDDIRRQNNHQADNAMRQWKLIQQRAKNIVRYNVEAVPCYYKKREKCAVCPTKYLPRHSKCLCKKVSYCSKECQKAHWNMGHKEDHREQVEKEKKLRLEEEHVSEVD